MYIYYSQQNFIDYTRNAIEGIVGQLDAINQIAGKIECFRYAIDKKAGCLCHVRRKM